LSREPSGASAAFGKVQESGSKEDEAEEGGPDYNNRSSQESPHRSPVMIDADQM